MTEQLVKCERCTRIRPLFQYTKFEEKIVTRTVDNGLGSDPRFSSKTEDIGDKRGLCEECAVFVNCAKYDMENYPRPKL